MRKENKRKKGIQRVRARNKQGARKKRAIVRQRGIFLMSSRDTKINVRENVGNSWLTCRAVN